MDPRLPGQPWAFQGALETSAFRAFLSALGKCWAVPEEVVLRQLEGLEGR